MPSYCTLFRKLGINEVVRRRVIQRFLRIMTRKEPSV